MKKDTIAAIATGMGNAGIGIVRISGGEAVLVADRIFKGKKGKKIKDMQSHTIHYGMIMDQEEIIDEVLVMVMRAPRSYTAEDTIEINCHGGALVTRKVLETVLKNGARAAEPGEFTKRAFLNGRIDLSQSESVIDLINAQNEFARKSSVSQLNGTLKNKIIKMRESILYEIAFIESALDDPEHISIDGYADRLEQLTDSLLEEVEQLLHSYQDGVLLKEGIHTVIVGKPNVGKSSLLNLLAGEERAIVTEIAGTTRDVLEESITIDGIQLNMMDTAGIRSTKDVVEKIGVERAKSYAQKADLILYVVDTSVELDENDLEIMNLLQDKKVLVLLNKSDLKPVVSVSDIKQKLDKDIVVISAKSQQGLTDLKEAVKTMFFKGSLSYNNELYITNERHKQALAECQESLRLVKESIENQLPEDFYSIDLMNAYEALGSIIGESVGEDLINEIFGKFCMGK